MHYFYVILFLSFVSIFKMFICYPRTKCNATKSFPFFFLATFILFLKHLLFFVLSLEHPSFQRLFSPSLYIFQYFCRVPHFRCFCLLLVNIHKLMQSLIIGSLFCFKRNKDHDGCNSKSLRQKS